MREELDKLLCEKYPRMFVNRNADMRETAMCWGFEHGDDGSISLMHSVQTCNTTLIGRMANVNVF